MRGVSANVMCGQEGFYGTSAFSVYLNTVEMEKLSEQHEYEEDDEDIFELMKQIESEEEIIKLTSLIFSIASSNLFYSIRE
jgi:hypothetical protein